MENKQDNEEMDKIIDEMTEIARAKLMAAITSLLGKADAAGILFGFDVTFKLESKNRATGEERSGHYRLQFDKVPDPPEELNPSDYARKMQGLATKNLDDLDMQDLQKKATDIIDRQIEDF